MAKLLKIGELASKSGVSRDTLRFYEREALLPKASRTPAGYRLYVPETVERLRFIKRAQALGFSLTEIRHLLDGYQDPEECSQVKHLLEQKIAVLDQKMREIQALRDVLGRYLEACQQALSTGQATGTCPVLLDLLRGSKIFST
jgi:MerR family Zn(II)-responsive transcriptional regulator of zntA